MCEHLKKKDVQSDHGALKTLPGAWTIRRGYKGNMFTQSIDALKRIQIRTLGSRAMDMPCKRSWKRTPMLRPSSS